MNKQYRTVKNFNGPYISHLPEIKVYEISPSDKYLILASDGMWELKSISGIEKIINNNKNKQAIAQKLFDSCIIKASRDAMISEEYLKSLSPGPEKRSLIDDITIMVVDLTNQTTNTR